jgi:hypothetical protein
MRVYKNHAFICFGPLRRDREQLYSRPYDDKLPAGSYLVRYLRAKSKCHRYEVIVLPPTVQILYPTLWNRRLWGS